MRRNGTLFVIRWGRVQRASTNEFFDLLFSFSRKWYKRKTRRHTTSQNWERILIRRHLEVIGWVLCLLLLLFSLSKPRDHRGSNFIRGPRAAENLRRLMLVMTSICALTCSSFFFSVLFRNSVDKNLLKLKLRNLVLLWNVITRLSNYSFCELNERFETTSAKMSRALDLCFAFFAETWNQRHTQNVQKQLSHVDDKSAARDLK